jgi:predicted protein tyrosine phosphatase
MIEIIPNLFIGSEDDYELTVRLMPGWCVVHACKEPYHRQALGYRGRGAPQNHPEYLIARRDNRLILNLVDVADPSFIRKEIVDAALSFIHQGLQEQKKVLVHCNKGESRGPSIGLLYLLSWTDKLVITDFCAAEDAFRKLYPLYNPAGGIRGFMQSNFATYIKI